MPRLLPFLLVAALAATSSAQNTAALINQELDKIVQLDLNTSLPQAMKAIGEKTGVRIEATPAVWDVLPYGEETNIKASISNLSLRDALSALTVKLGLTWVLREQAVELRPMPAMTRLGQRATTAELAALDILTTTPLNTPGDKTSVANLFKSVDARLQEVKAPYAIDNRSRGIVGDDRTLSIARNASLADALESLTAETKATWYPWGKSIVIVPKEDVFRAMLAKPISIRYDGVDISQVLSELADRSGVNFVYEPGAVQRVPSDFRKVKLVLVDTPVKQALENLAAFTGLGYQVNDAGVYIWNATYGFGAGGRDPVLATLQLGGGVTVVITESRCPPDIREYIEHKTRELYTKTREEMKTAGFVPTTKPTTRPNEDL